MCGGRRNESSGATTPKGIVACGTGDTMVRGRCTQRALPILSPLNWPHMQVVACGAFYFLTLKVRAWAGLASAGQGFAFPFSLNHFYGSPIV
jgi:hypothetical protein